jgi:hypothetical protein
VHTLLHAAGREQRKTYSKNRSRCTPTQAHFCLCTFRPRPVPDPPPDLACRHFRRDHHPHPPPNPPDVRRHRSPLRRSAVSAKACGDLSHSTLPPLLQHSGGDSSNSVPRISERECLIAAVNVRCASRTHPSPTPHGGASHQQPRHCSTLLCDTHPSATPPSISAIVYAYSPLRLCQTTPAPFQPRFSHQQSLSCVRKPGTTVVVWTVCNVRCLNIRGCQKLTPLDPTFLR